MDITEMIIQLLIVPYSFFIEAFYGHLALGAISGIVVSILVLCFWMKSGTPPTYVIYIIITVFTCTIIMQPTCRKDWLIQLSEKLLRKHEDHITFFAPLFKFIITVLVGTGQRSIYLYAYDL